MSEQTVQELNQLQKEYATQISARQVLESQLQENSTLLREIGYLKEGEKMYKQIGKILIDVEVEEAKANVEKRLEWIQKEYKRVEGAIAEVEIKQENKRNEILKLQQTMTNMQSKEVPAQ